MTMYQTLSFIINTEHNDYILYILIKSGNNYYRTISHNSLIYLSINKTVNILSFIITHCFCYSL